MVVEGTVDVEGTEVGTAVVVDNVVKVSAANVVPTVDELSVEVVEAELVVEDTAGVVEVEDRIHDTVVGPVSDFTWTEDIVDQLSEAVSVLDASVVVVEACDNDDLVVVGTSAASAASVDTGVVVSADGDLVTTSVTDAAAGAWSS